MIVRTNSIVEANSQRKFSYGDVLVKGIVQEDKVEGEISHEGADNVLTIEQLDVNASFDEVQEKLGKEESKQLASFFSCEEKHIDPDHLAVMSILERRKQGESKFSPAIIFSRLRRLIWCVHF